MSGLEELAIPIVLEGVPAIWKLVDGLRQSDADALGCLAKQVEHDLKFAKTFHDMVGGIPLPHQDMMTWFHTNCLRAETALNEFKNHLPKMENNGNEDDEKPKPAQTGNEKKPKPKFSERAKYYLLNQSKMVDLEKSLRCSHSALLAGINLAYPVIMSQSLVAANHTASSTRASSMPPSVLALQKAMANEKRWTSAVDEV